MSETIRMGNDEFILHLRKRHPTCALRNPDIGQRIAEWLRSNASGRDLGEEPCRWDPLGAGVGERALPKTAHQFEFRRDGLPDLFDFLDSLGAM